MKSPITTHVLDTALGRPAAAIPVSLAIWSDNGWQQIANGVTDADGRITDLLLPGTLTAGQYQITFVVEDYFADGNAFYPFVSIVFTIDNPAEHYHVPLLLSPFGYSTYRGS